MRRHLQGRYTKRRSRRVYYQICIKQKSRVKPAPYTPLKIDWYKKRVFITQIRYEHPTWVYITKKMPLLTRVSSSKQKKRVRTRIATRLSLVRVTGLEPAAPWPPVKCATNCATPGYKTNNWNRLLAIIYFAVTIKPYYSNLCNIIFLKRTFYELL